MGKHIVFNRIKRWKIIKNTLIVLQRIKMRAMQKSMQDDM